MSDAVLQSIIGGSFSVIVALINRNVGVKNSTEIRDEGKTDTVKKPPFTKTRIFVFIVAPVLGGLAAFIVFLAGGNVVQAVGRPTPAPLRAPTPISGNFYPSGWMGDIKGIEINSQWSLNCHPGPTCVQIKYTPGPASFAGVYWQYPDSNWGDFPGRKVEGAKKLVFFARGQIGGEVVSFRSGGIEGNGKKYQDSFNRVCDPPYVKLTTEWQPYEIDLSGADLSSVIGAFSWSATKDGNPQGSTFYLDGMYFR